MKNLALLLNEAEENAAHKQAVGMGLKYRGFGYWEDPTTGDVKYKTEGEQLVAVDQEEAAAKGTPGGDGQPMGGGQPGGGLQGLGTGMQMQQPGDTMPQVGTLPLGAPEPGEELAFTTMEWEPGPDGSTCVNSDEPAAEVPEDSFVTRSNNMKWGAGPDGTNYQNIDYDKLLQDLKSPNLDNFLNKMQRQKQMGTMREGMTFFDMYMSEAPMQAGMGQRTAADEAHQAGLTYNGYGYWSDRSGQVVAKTEDGQLKYLEGDQKQPTTATLDMGNPTSQASGMTPAAKARSMGLQSNGSGGYVDQEGNVIARTVNNELVFYDSRAGGGAVSDGSGGALITQSAPSWVDPVTGLIVVPPAQPESPEEINAVPDPVPATAPYGYDSFVNKKKKEMYRQNYIETQANQDIEARQAEVDQAYQSSPGALKFKEMFDEKQAAARESGDQARMETADVIQRELENNAQETATLFNTIGADEHQMLTDLLKQRTIMRAKEEQAGEQLNFGDSSPDFADAQIYNMLDRAEGRVPVRKINEPEEINGDGIDYLFHPAKSGYLTSYEANKAAREAGSDIRVKAEDAPILDVSWEVQGDSPYEEKKNRKKYNPSQSKRLALNALKMWRQDVLPQLTPGTIVRADAIQSEDEATPGSPTAGQNQRARIYALAGFGRQGRYEGQYGLVIKDEKGENKLIPMFDGPDEIEEAFNQQYLDALMGDLNILEEEIVYEMLFT